MNVKNLLLITMMLVFTIGCSGTYRAYYQTLKITFEKQNDAEMKIVEVQQSTTDIIAVKREERPIAIMALAYLENGQHKWVSTDNVMLIMETGRIIRTLGLGDNLMYLSNLDIDPLKSLPYSALSKNEPQQVSWSFIVDLTNDEYGYPIESIFSQPYQDTMQALNLNIEAVLYVETLRYNAPAEYIQLSKSWKNYYWYAKSGELIKTRQKVSPLSESLEITYLSRIARLN